MKKMIWMLLPATLVWVSSCAATLDSSSAFTGVASSSSRLVSLTLTAGTGGRAEYPSDLTLMGSVAPIGDSNTNFIAVSGTLSCGSVSGPIYFYSDRNSRFIVRVKGLAAGSGNAVFAIALSDGRVSTNTMPLTVNAALPSPGFDGPAPLVYLNSNSYQVSGTNPDTNMVSASWFTFMGNRSNVTLDPAWNFNLGGFFQGANEMQLSAVSTGFYTNDLSTLVLFYDTFAPEIAASYPASGAADVTLTNLILVQFNEPVRTNTIPGAVLVMEGTNAIAATNHWEAASNTLRVCPTALLKPDVTYTVMVSNSIQDLAGNPFLSNAFFSFSTFFSPVAQAPAVPGTTKISVTDPAHATTNMRFKSKKITWNLSPSRVKKYFLLISTTPIIGTAAASGQSARLSTDGAIKYWMSDYGSDGNVDMVLQTYDMVNGVPQKTTNSVFVNDQVYHLVVYGVDSWYRLVDSSPEVLFRW